MVFVRLIISDYSENFFLLVIATPPETTTAKQQTTPPTVEQKYQWYVYGIKNSVKYTGKQVKQSLKITCNGTTLKEGRDYKLFYKNNVKAGKAALTITPVGQYKGIKPYIINFTILKVSITSASSNKIKAQKYKKGKAIKPSVILKYKGQKLKKGKDYIISYKNNKKKGTAKIIVKGKGNFSGTKTIKFKIK